MLLDAGADPNAPDDDDWKPLNLAKASGHQAIVELLEPLTNDDYGYLYSDHGTEDDDYESTRARSNESDEKDGSGREDQANTHDSKEEQGHQSDLAVRPKDPTQAE